jgi:hypothetical protein
MSWLRFEPNTSRVKSRLLLTDFIQKAFVERKLLLSCTYVLESMKLVNFFGYRTLGYHSPPFYSIPMKGKILLPDVGSFITV